MTFITDHEQRRPDKRILDTLGAPQLPGYAEIGELDLARIGKDDVGRFDVPVNDSLAVEVGETVQDLTEDDGCLRFVQGSRFDLTETSSNNVSMAKSVLDNAFGCKRLTISDPLPPARYSMMIHKVHFLPTNDPR